MIYLHLCSMSAICVVLYGMLAPFMKTAHSQDHAIMTYGLIQTLLLFVVGLGNIA